VVLEAPEVRARLASAARASVERYSWQRIADEHLALYDAVLATHPGNLAAAR
jgi:glycosyltransferase involved in cell wall biosynthesis